jgi:hypothetical protein
MSHHIIIVKVWAGDAEEAEDIVAGAMEESINDANNTVGWDYFDKAVFIKESDLLRDHGVKTFKELEKKLLAARHEHIIGLSEQIKDGIKPLLAPYFLTKDEASLHITTEDDEFKKCVEKILKRKKDINPPKDFEKIVDTFTNLVVNIAKKDTGHLMLMFYMERIKRLQYCIDDSSPYNTLQSDDNYYAELPCDEDKKQLKPFYFSCDRHL